MSDIPEDYAGFKAWIEERYPEIPWPQGPIKDMPDDVVSECVRAKGSRAGLVALRWQLRLQHLSDEGFSSFVRDYRDDKEPTSWPEDGLIEKEATLRTQLRILKGEMDK
jgi:hypothetical protein